MASQLALLLCATTLAAPAALCQQTYDLREAYDPGRTVMVTDLISIKMTIIPSRSEGAAADLRGDFMSREESEIQYSIMKALDGKPSLVNAQVLAASSVEQTPGSPAETTALPFKGTEFVLKRAADGMYDYLDGQQNLLDRETARKWLGAPGAALSDAVDLSALQVGQEFVLTGDAARRFFRDESGGDVTLTGRLTEVRRRQGRELARVDFTVTMSQPWGESEGDFITLDLKGSYLFDLDNRVAHYAEGKGKAAARFTIVQDGERLGVGYMEGPFMARTRFDLITNPFARRPAKVRCGPATPW